MGITDTINNLRNKTRICGITMFDIVGTIIVATVIYRLFNNSFLKYVSPTKYYASLLPLAVLIHLLFGIKTPFNKGLFEDSNVVYWVLLLSSIYLYIIN